MKKLFLVAAAAAALGSAGCASDQILDAPAQSPIAFAGNFIDRHTRSTDLGDDGSQSDGSGEAADADDEIQSDPSFTVKTLGSFEVYGWQHQDDGSKLLFNGDVVSSDNEGSTWTYSPIKYWVSGASYSFRAIAPTGETPDVSIDSNKKISLSIKNFENTGEKDLIVASQVDVTAETPQTEAVSFTFKHLLSKVKFTFVNGFDSDADVTLQVKEVTISDAYKTADVEVNVNSNNADEVTWSNRTGSLELSFGDTNKIRVSASSSTDEEAPEEVDTQSSVMSSKAITRDPGEEGGEAEGDEAGTSSESTSSDKVGSDVATYERLLIPTDEDGADFTVTFKVDIIANVSGGSGLGDEFVTTTYEHEVTIKELVLEAGNSYNLKATLDADNVDPDNALAEIKFTVNEISDWASNDDVDVPVPTPTDTENKEENVN